MRPRRAHEAIADPQRAAQNHICRSWTAADGSAGAAVTPTRTPRSGPGGDRTIRSAGAASLPHARPVYDAPGTMADTWPANDARRIEDPSNAGAIENREELLQVRGELLSRSFDRRIDGAPGNPGAPGRDAINGASNASSPGRIRAQPRPRTTWEYAQGSALHYTIPRCSRRARGVLGEGPRRTGASFYCELPTLPCISEQGVYCISVH